MRKNVLYSPVQSPHDDVASFDYEFFEKILFNSMVSSRLTTDHGFLCPTQLPFICDVDTNEYLTWPTIDSFIGGLIRD